MSRKKTVQERGEHMEMNGNFHILSFCMSEDDVRKITKGKEKMIR